MTTTALRGLLAAAALFVTAPDLRAQDLPVPPGPSCRSELDERLAFGLCPDATFDFYATGEYRPEVPRPDEVLGYPLGSWHTTYGRMERYLEALAAAIPERVRVFDYGRSVERQIMHLVAISSEANIQRLDGVRETLQALSDPRRTSATDADALIADLPVVVWLNAANDGNETAAFEAAMQLAYQLAAGDDPRTAGLREGAVTLINLAHNPESHERHVAWYNAFVAGDANPASLEHRAPWGMSTNNNHYQFDLNRDGLGLTQTESRAVSAEMQRWRPQVFVDLHGQTTQMFFPPAAAPINPLYPSQTAEWLEIFGAANGAAMDAFGWSYYVRDRFDLHFPGYWDSYPALHGATGMTFETDGGGSKGVRWRRDDGTILTFADGIAHHFVASLATVETAVRHREARLRAYYDYFASAVNGIDADMRFAVIVPGAMPNRAARLATTLLRHGVEVHRVTGTGRVTATDYLTGASGLREVPTGAYLVDLAQPNARLAAAYLLPDVPVPVDFANQELARWARNARRAPAERERYTFYDINAWNLVLASGVTGYWGATAHQLVAEPLRLPEGTARAPGGWHGERAWTTDGGTTGRARSAYVWAPGDRGSYRLTARLLDEGFNVAWVTKPMVVDGTEYPRGSFIARIGRNGPALHDRMDVLARDASVTVMAAASAFPDRGPTGTGSEDTRSLNPPQIAVLAGEGVSITSYGSLWFELEQRIGYPFTPIRASDVATAALEFDVVIIPEGSYARALGTRGRDRLTAWIRDGGTLVAYGSGARYVMDEEFGTSHEAEDDEPPSDDERARRLAGIDASAPPGIDLPPSMSPEARPDAPQPVPGAFLRGRLDQTHWLTVGYDGDEIALLMRGLPLRRSERGANPVVFADGDRVVIAGFTWPGNTGPSYGGAPYATVDRVERGRVVLFANDPLFRGVFDAPARLLFNAVFLGAPGRPDAQRPRGGTD